MEDVMAKSPQALQQAARKALDQPLVFIRSEDGATVDASEVPPKERGRLEGARRSVLNRIANNPDFAKRINDATEREDREEAARITRETPGLPEDVKITVTGIKGNNNRIEWEFCIWIFCTKGEITW
jgi:hypothetical protein